MAITGIQDTNPDYNAKAAAARKAALRYAASVRNSATYMDPTDTPTKADLSLESKLEDARYEESAAEQSEFRERWTSKAKEKAVGAAKVAWKPVSKVLHAIQVPLFGVAGVVKHAVGKGDATLAETVMGTMKEGEEFTGLLEEMGVGRKTSAVLGFGLDVALDPLTWMTAGTSAIVPKLAVGAKKGIPGLTAAAKAYGAQKTSKAAQLAGRFTGATKTAKRIEEAFSTGSAEFGAARDEALRRMANSGISDRTFSGEIDRTLKVLSEGKSGEVARKAAEDMLALSGKGKLSPSRILDLNASAAKYEKEFRDLVGLPDVADAFANPNLVQKAMGRVEGVISRTAKAAFGEKGEEKLAGLKRFLSHDPVAGDVAMLGKRVAGKDMGLTVLDDAVPESALASVDREEKLRRVKAAEDIREDLDKVHATGPTVVSFGEWAPEFRAKISTAEKATSAADVKFSFRNPDVAMEAVRLKAVDAVKNGTAHIDAAAKEAVQLYQLDRIAKSKRVGLDLRELLSRAKAEGGGESLERVLANDPQGIDVLIGNTTDFEGVMGKLESQFTSLHPELASGPVPVRYTKEFFEYFDKKTGLVKDISSTIAAFRSDISRYDAALASVILKSPATKNALRFTDLYHGLFRAAKLGGNVVRQMFTQSLSSFLGLQGMAGFKVFSSDHFESMGRAMKFAFNPNDVQFYKSFADDPRFLAQVMDDPELFKSVLGVDPMILADRKAFISSVVGRMRQEFPDLVPKSEKSIKELDRVFGDLDQAVKDLSRTGDRGAFSESIVRIGEMNGIDLRKYADVSLTSEDYSGVARVWQVGVLREFAAKAAAKAGTKDAGLAWKAADLYLNTAGAMFGAPDRVSRIGTFIRMSSMGVDADELGALMRNYGVKAQEIQQMRNQSGALVNRFIFDPATSARVSAAMHVNFAHQPYYMKMMRNLPVVGSTFISFSLSSAQLAYKAAKANPAFFSRVQSASAAIGGTPGPSERVDLSDPANQKLEDPKYWRTTMFSQDPMYVDMSMLLPWYGLGIMDGDERDYTSKTGQVINSLLNDYPYLKEMFQTPEGRIILDYAVLPAITKEAVNSFGSPLWPSDAGPLEKVMLAARDLGEAVVPTGLGYGAGLVKMPGSEDPEFLSWFPLYRYRALQNAIYGRTTGGMETQKTPAELKQRQYSSMFLGMPYTSVYKPSNK